MPGMTKKESLLVEKNNMIYEHQHPLIFEFKPKVYVTNQELFDQIQDKKFEIAQENAKQMDINDQSEQEKQIEVQVELPEEYTPLA